LRGNKKVDGMTGVFVCCAWYVDGLIALRSEDYRLPQFKWSDAETASAGERPVLSASVGICGS
jgi:hypothetical protein